MNEYTPVYRCIACGKECRWTRSVTMSTKEMVDAHWKLLTMKNEKLKPSLFGRKKVPTCKMPDKKSVPLWVVHECSDGREQKMYFSSFAEEGGELL